MPSDALPAGARLVRGITPHSDAWKDLWQTSDLFVMPARHEAFGLVYQEAAAAGLPVVATRINAVPELVEDGRTGILVPPGDSAALVRAMQALVDSAELRRRMGAAALARIATATPAAYAARLHLLITAALQTSHVSAA
jgi:glycosyltransferase involved in cell wall biosynthesis